MSTFCFDIVVNGQAERLAVPARDVPGDAAGRAAWVHTYEARANAYDARQRVQRDVEALFRRRRAEAEAARRLAEQTEQRRQVRALALEEAEARRVAGLAADPQHGVALLWDLLLYEIAPRLDFKTQLACAKTCRRLHRTRATVTHLPHAVEKKLTPDRLARLPSLTQLALSSRLLLAHSMDQLSQLKALHVNQHGDSVHHATETATMGRAIARAGRRGLTELSLGSGLPAVCRHGDYAALTALTTLRIMGTLNIPDPATAPCLARLSTLRLWRAAYFADATLVALTSLTTLDLGPDSDISDEAVARLPLLRALTLRNLVALRTPADVTYDPRFARDGLAALTALTTLVLDMTGDYFHGHMPRLPALRVLSLEGGSRVEQAQLATLTALTALRVHGDGLSIVGLAPLTRLAALWINPGRYGIASADLAQVVSLTALVCLRLQQVIGTAFLPALTRLTHLYTNGFKRREAPLAGTTAMLIQRLPSPEEWPY